MSTNVSKQRKSFNETAIPVCGRDYSAVSQPREINNNNKGGTVKSGVAGDSFKGSVVV